jgi:hypothetical protein
MKLNNTIAAFLAKSLTKSLIEQKLVEIEERELFKIVLDIINSNIEEERKIEEEVHRILKEHIDLVEREGISYQKLFQKIKEKIAKERGFPI